MRYNKLQNLTGLPRQALTSHSYYMKAACQVLWLFSVFQVIFWSLWFMPLSWQRKKPERWSKVVQLLLSFYSKVAYIAPIHVCWPKLIICPSSHQWGGEAYLWGRGISYIYAKGRKLFVNSPQYSRVMRKTKNGSVLSNSINWGWDAENRKKNGSGQLGSSH